MPEVFSVETSLLLNDRMLAGLRSVSRELRTIQGQLERMKATSTALGSSPLFAASGLGQMQRMRQALSGVALEARRAQEALGAMTINPEAVAGAGRLSRSLGTATSRAAALRAELAGIRLPAGGFLPPRGPGGHGPGGRGPFSARFDGGPVRGHFGLSGAEVGALILGGGLIGGLKWAGEEQRSLLAAVLASGNAPSSPAGQQEYNELRQIAEEASRHSIFSPAMVAKAFPNILGLTDVPYQEAKPFLLPVTRFAETSQIIGNAQGKNVSIEESAAAAIRVAQIWESSIRS